jgi:hypothetical protein
MLRKISFVGVAMFIAVAATSGCAATGAASGSNQSIITQEELAATGANTLHEAIQRLRPRWLTVRSSQTFGGGAGETAILVYQNQTRLGGVDVLRELSPTVAVWIQYLDGPTASASLPGIGSQDVEAAIVIHTTPRT